MASDSSMDNGMPFDSKWNMKQLGAIWSIFVPQLHPFTRVLCIEGHTWQVLDDEAKRFIAQNFMAHVLEDVMYCRDAGKKDRYYLGAPQMFVAGGAMLVHVDGFQEPLWVVPEEARAQIASVNNHPAIAPKHHRIPRPPNAYILYRKERHNLVKDANPGITNNEICESYPCHLSSSVTDRSAQILGRAWNSETKEVRAKYKKLADEVKQRLLDEHPDYQYKPRRPCERRRRRRSTAGASNGSPVSGSPDVKMEGLAQVQ